MTIKSVFIGSALLFFCSLTVHAQLAPLTVDKIMRDPKWIGTSPSSIYWNENSKSVYFNWNPENNPEDSLYGVSVTNPLPVKVSIREKMAAIPVSGTYNKTFTKKIFEKNGDLFLLDLKSHKITTITNTLEYEYNPVFSSDETKVLFTANNNLFSWDISHGTLAQLTDFKKGNKKTDTKTNNQEKWLLQDQLANMQILRERHEKKSATEKFNKLLKPKRPKTIYIDDKNIDQIQLSPDGHYITYRLTKSGTGKNTIIPHYITESGFTETNSSRTKVGAPPSLSEFFVYDLRKDTTLSVSLRDVPGIFDVPAFQIDYTTVTTPEDQKEKKPDPRAVSLMGPYWNEAGTQNVIIAYALDNKDRWLLSLEPSTQKLKLLDRQHDDAWIGGPGIGFGRGRSLGWINSNQFWFQSEESGYAHLYVYDFSINKKLALTNGKYEVQSVVLSRDKQNFYLTTNQVHPGEKHFYKLPVTGGIPQKITTLTGANEVTMSPDEKWLAIRYSYSNKPWELYLQENKPGAKAQQITSSLSNEFKSYPWRDPEVTTFQARDGAMVYTRLYKPTKPTGAAVIFVHGAGYLQNAHKWWSSYFREYMFHNLLADMGYTVIDVDYRASAGYGRDWRTGIYRFMGGKDLTDHVDAAKWLVEKHGIDPTRIGIYGGSYGGFITLMGMFTTPDVFAAGAALRPVTDWAHYNHGYTSNILNQPFTDSIAYAKSSPIYHAEGLKGHLLICHGMVDDNVHVEDVIRLSQRLIELGKDNWEMALYPVEDHGFVEPSSWTDEYKRILKLFDRTLNKP